MQAQPQTLTNAELKAELIRSIHRISNQAYSTKKLLMCKDAIDRVLRYKS